MKKYLKLLALVILVVPVAIVMTACGIGKKIDAEDAIAAIAKADYDITTWGGAQLTASGKVSMSEKGMSATVKMKANVKAKFSADSVAMSGSLSMKVSAKSGGVKFNSNVNVDAYAKDSDVYVKEGKQKNKITLDSNIMDLVFGLIDELLDESEPECDFCDGEGCWYCEGIDVDGDDGFLSAISKAGKKNVSGGYAITLVMQEKNTPKVTFVFTFDKQDKLTKLKITASGSVKEDGMTVKVSGLKLELKKYTGNIKPLADLGSYNPSTLEDLEDIFAGIPLFGLVA